MLAFHRHFGCKVPLCVKDFHTLALSMIDRFGLFHMHAISPLHEYDIYFFVHFVLGTFLTLHP